MGVTEPTAEQKFLETQYTALRTEIDQASERAFKIFAASVLAVPTGLALGSAGNVLPLILMLLPLLLLAFYAMYWAQLFSTYRAGLYIAMHIEPRLLDGTQGWEVWLTDRRYLYDAQLNVAFFLLSAVYYFGTVYLAATAATPLKDLFTGILPGALMLFIFYALAGLVVFFLVQLVPDRQLKEEEKVEQLPHAPDVIENTPEAIQSQFVDNLQTTKKRCVNWDDKLLWRFFGKRFGGVPLEGRIKRYHCHTDPLAHTPQSRHVRLTIKEASWMETMRNYRLHFLAAMAAVVGLLFWAFMSIQRFYDELAKSQGITLEWMQQPGIVLVLIVLTLAVLSVLVFLPYDIFVGRNLGARVDVSFLPAKDHAANHPRTRFIVQTSVEELKPLKCDGNEWVRKILNGGRTPT
jgi:heme/copper-type cytochrome/quinol oxidase subunit 2